MKERYLQSVKDYEKLCDACIKLSINTHHRKVETWREEYGSHIYAKIATHSVALLKLIPESSLFKLPNNFEVWDVSSLAVLVRALMETYYVFHYLIIEEIPEEELEFRFILWHLHAESERLRMLKAIGSTNPKIGTVEKDIAALKAKLLQNSFYLTKNSDARSKYRKGEEGIALSNSQISEKAGISINYYKSTYKFLSSYTHTFPFSIQQVSTFKVDDEESINLLKGLVDISLGYISFAIRDYVKLFPDQDSSTKDIRDIMNIWLDVLKKIATNVTS